MAKFTRTQRFLRQFKWIRGLALRHLKDLRAQQRESRWSYEQSVLVGIGNLIFTWSFIERQLNTLICNYHPHAPENLRRRSLPSTIGEKITYLVEVGKDERLPPHLRKSISEWIPQLGRLKNHRHLIAHGTMFQRNRNSTDWYVQELVMKNDNPALREHLFTHEQLNEKSREIHDLSHRMASVLNPIFFGPDWAKK